MTDKDKQLKPFLMMDVNAIREMGLDEEKFIKLWNGTGWGIITPLEPEELPEEEAVQLLTHIMREADRQFERIGGSTRHYVRDILLPMLEQAGIKLCRVNQKQEPFDLDKRTTFTDSTD